MLLKTDGVVIREKGTGESDRFVTLLTRDYGVLHAFARGAKSLKSEKQSGTQLFAYADFTVSRGKDAFIVTEARAREVFYKLRENVEHLALAQYFCELSGLLAPEETPAEDEEAPAEPSEGEEEEVVSVAPADENEGEETDAACTSPSITRDGSRITFVSAASNLVSNCNGQPQVYMVNRERSSVTLKLKKGWNLCGTSLKLDDGSVALLKNESACWVWADGRFSPMETLHAGQGFWLYAFEDKTLRLTGEEAEPVPLRHGWNLVMASSYPEIELAKCFGFDGKAYVKLSEEAKRSLAVWVFR